MATEPKEESFGVWQEWPNNVLDDQANRGSNLKVDSVL
jgi:hypothetical protein